jgi:probable phosphoglycerate mutase
MKRYIYLLRHGETEYGREKRYLGHTDCKLSEEGREQAKRLAGIFERDKTIIDNIFSSDLSRCKDTINIVFPNQKVTFLENLREINMGDWDGLTFDEVKSKYAEDYKKRGENIGGFIPRNGESFEQCQNRAVAVFRHIVNSTEGNIVICSHVGFIRTLLCNILNKELAEMFNIKQGYGCINIITVDENNILVENINLTHCASKI